MATEISVVELTNVLQGKIIGNSSEEIRVAGTCAIDHYVRKKVSFVRNKKYGEMLSQLQNAVILIPENMAEFCQRYPQNIYIVVKDIIDSIIKIQDFFYGQQAIITEEGISETARVDKSVEIGSRVYIGEHVVVSKNVVISDGTKIMHNSSIGDDVAIGNRTYIYPGVCIYRNCQIGNDCIVHSGTKIGVDGFRFEQDVEEKLVRKLLHVGKVTIENRVEIGANCTIDRATFEDEMTLLSHDVKLDDQVHIGHNAKIGARSCFAAQTCISGSVKIGEDVWIGAGVTVSNGVNIGNRAKVLLNAVVAYDVPEDEVVSGFYAMPHRQWKRVYTKLREEL